MRSRSGPKLDADWLIKAGGTCKLWGKPLPTTRTTRVFEAKILRVLGRDGSLDSFRGSPRSDCIRGKAGVWAWMCGL